MIIKIVGTQRQINTTPSSVDNARVVRLLNNAGGGANAVITVRDTSNNVIGNTTINSGNELILEKGSSDTIEADSDLLGTPIAYTIS